MNGVTVRDLHKSFGANPVLHGLDLSVQAGSLTSILGDSGSGKTTLLRVLAGLERPDRGMITIGDRLVDGELQHVPPDRRRIGYVPQEGALFPHLTVEANVAFGLRRGHSERVAVLLDLVGLAHLAGRYPHQLSGGQQQRVALARALAVRPELILLDEPFASLDSRLRAEVRAEVRVILRGAGTTALLVTHDQDEALSLGDFVAVIRDGRVAQSAIPGVLYERPLDPAIASFVGDANLLEGMLEDGMVVTFLGRLPTLRLSNRPVDRRVTVLVRPEQIELDPDGEGGTAGEIVGTEYHGHDTLYQVRPAGNPKGQPVVVRVLGKAPLLMGATVRMRTHGPVRVWP
jgi:iron(III) transport system ATP-binding protein